MQTTGTRPLGVTALVIRLGELFMAGRLREAAGLWTFPCPVEIDGEFVVMRDADSLEAFFRRRLEAAVAAGVIAMTPRVIAIEVPRNGRFRVWLRWISHFADRTGEDAIPSLYYMLRKPSGQLSIEMMELVRLPVGARSA